jgi:hypothetical protein
MFILLHAIILRSSAKPPRGRGRYYRRGVHGAYESMETVRRMDWLRSRINDFHE